MALVDFKSLKLPLLLMGPISLLLIGCAGLKPKCLSGENKTNIVSRAREMVIGSVSVEVTNEEADFLKSKDPEFSYYPLAGLGYSDYSMSWSLDSGGKLIVSGKGDPRTLQGAKVSRIEGEVNSSP